LASCVLEASTAFSQSTSFVNFGAPGAPPGSRPGSSVRRRTSRRTPRNCTPARSAPAGSTPRRPWPASRQRLPSSRPLWSGCSLPRSPAAKRSRAALNCIEADGTVL